MQWKGEALHFGRWHCSGSETGSDRVLLTLEVLTNVIVANSQNVFQGAGGSVRRGVEKTEDWAPAGIEPAVAPGPVASPTQTGGQGPAGSASWAETLLWSAALQTNKSQNRPQTCH